jgi:hypothetical protein
MCFAQYSFGQINPPSANIVKVSDKHKDPQTNLTNTKGLPGSNAIHSPSPTYCINYKALEGVSPNIIDARIN